MAMAVGVGTSLVTLGVLFFALASAATISTNGARARRDLRAAGMMLVMLGLSILAGAGAAWAVL